MSSNVWYDDAVAGGLVCDAIAIRIIKSVQFDGKWVEFVFEEPDDWNEEYGGNHRLDNDLALGTTASSKSYRLCGAMKNALLSFDSETDYVGLKTLWVKLGFSWELVAIL